MSRRRGARMVLAAELAWLLSVGAPPGVAARAADGHASPPPPHAFAPGLSSDTDLLLLPGARRPPPRPVVTAATRVAARAADVATVFLTPALLREALPALIRADVISTRPGPRPDAWPDRLIDWEVEVPLFNLKGKAWLRQRPEGAELTLVEGAFAPGTIRFRATPAAPGFGAAEAAILTCQLQVEARTANWIFRKVARHDPWAETGMSAAMVWVVARAVALRAEARPGAAPQRPVGRIQAPDAQALQGAPLALPALAPLRAAGMLAAVRRAPSGRLAWSSAGIQVAGAASATSTRLGTPETWRAFPGWKSLKRLPAPANSSARAASPPANTLIAVEDDLALVDLDAVWSVDLTASVRATAVEGDIRGAVFSWQVWPGDVPGTSLAVLVMNPRLDAAGYIERKLIEAEPLLEHALAVALCYVDAAAIADELAKDSTGAPSSPPR